MKIYQETLLLAYFDDIVVIGKIRKEVQATTKVFYAILLVGLCVNEDNTKHMVMSKNNLNLNANYLLLSNLKFRSVDNFKYLGVNINNKSNVYHKVNVMSYEQKQILL